MADYLEEVFQEVGVTAPQGVVQVHPDMGAVNTQPENLRLLAAVGSTQGYLGKNFSLGDVEKLSDKDVAKFYIHYQAVLSRKLQETAVSGVLRVAVKALEALLPFAGMRLRDEAALLQALQNDELVTTEISNDSSSWVVNRFFFSRTPRMRPYTLVQNTELGSPPPSLDGIKPG